MSDEIRKVAISGTDAAAICGVSKWMTPADCWLKKKHPYSIPEPSEETKELLELGKELEPIAAKMYIKRTGDTIFKPNPTLMVHSKFSWLIGSPDYLVKGKPIGCEFKAPIEFSRREWGQEGTDAVPFDCLFQCHHYMLLTGFKQWNIGTLIGGRQFRMYQVFFHREVAERLLAQEEDFLNRFILGAEKPPLDYGKSCAEFIKRLYPKSKDKTIVVDPYSDKRVKDMLTHHADVKAKHDQFEKEEESSANKIKEFMAENAYLQFPEEGIDIRWRTEKPKIEIDWESVSKEVLSLLKKTREEKEKIIVDNTKTVAVADFQAMAMTAMADMSMEEKDKIIAKYTTTEPGRRPFHFRCKE